MKQFYGSRKLHISNFLLSFLIFYLSCKKLNWRLAIQSNNNGYFWKITKPNYTANKYERNSEKMKISVKTGVLLSCLLFSYILVVNWFPTYFWLTLFSVSVSLCTTDSFWHRAILAMRKLYLPNCDSNKGSNYNIVLQGQRRKSIIYW